MHYNYFNSQVESKVPYIAYIHIYCITVKCKQCGRYKIDGEINKISTRTKRAQKGQSHFKAHQTYL